MDRSARKKHTSPAPVVRGAVAGLLRQAVRSAVARVARDPQAALLLDGWTLEIEIPKISVRLRAPTP